MLLFEILTLSFCVVPISVDLESFSPIQPLSLLQLEALQ